MDVASPWGRRAPLVAGLLTVLLTVAGIVIPGETPDFLDDPKEIVEFYTDDSGRLILAAYLGMLGTVSFIWFVGILRNRLRQAEVGEGRLSAIAFGGGIAASAPLFMINLFNMAGAMRADEDGAIEPYVATTLYDLSALSISVAAFAVSVLVFATSALALRTGVLPRWLAYLGILLGIVLLTPVAYVGLGVFLLWVLIVSICLYLQPAVATTPPIGTTPA